MSIHNSESSTGNSSSHELSSQTRKRAKVWEHFEQELVVVDGVPKAQCKYCRLMLTATKKLRTSHLINHVCDSCPLVEVEVRNRFIAIARKQPVSADRKPTAHSFLHLVLCIRHALSDFDWQTTSVLTQLASAMRTKFSKYWDEKLPNNFNLALVISTVLDPRRKRDYLEFFYAKVSPNINEAETKVDYVIEWMKSYFRVYEEIARRRGVSFLSHSGQGEASGVGSPVLGKRKLDQEFAIFKSNRTRIHKSEIETYLEEVCEDDSKHFDVLAWWKRNAKRFPILAIMARDFLAIPLSTVPSESAFSCGERILGDTRSSLTPDMLEALVCVKDWLFKPKKQDQST